MPPKSKRVLPGKRYPLNMRTTKELRDKIEWAATVSGRSLVQEVESRLEGSFQEEEIEKSTGTVKLQVRLSERLHGRLEQAAKDNDWSMNTEIWNRLDVSLQRDELEKEIGGVIEQAIHNAATGTARRLVQELRQSGLIPDQMARPQEATKHPGPPDKEEHSK
jgi:predicted HicB family RNase H-like nuclease